MSKQIQKQKDKVETFRGYTKITSSKGKTIFRCSKCYGLNYTNSSEARLKLHLRTFHKDE